MLIFAVMITNNSFTKKYLLDAISEFYLKIQKSLHQKKAYIKQNFILFLILRYFNSSVLSLI